MELKSITGQSGKSLLEFYNPKKWPENWGEMPEMMCNLIKTLHAIEHDPVWVFTSHAELLFTYKDDFKYWQVLVKIVTIDERQFYKITAAQEDPWHHLTGFTDNHKVASDLVISGLKNSVIGKNRNIFFDAN